ncbi:MAG: hypothetical protein U0556_14930 [Dehalococcoidia bacterium]
MERSILRETGEHSPQEFARRVRWLAASYVAMASGSVAGIVILIWQGALFVDLAQRSNVETLVLAFLLVFFGYLTLISAPGAFGALRLVWFWLRALGGDTVLVDRRKAAALGPPTGPHPRVALNILLEAADAPGEPMRFELHDEAGDLGPLTVDGAQVTHQHAHRDGAYSLLPFFIHQVNLLLRERGEPGDVEIVEWDSTNDEAAALLISLTRFARNLGRRLGEPALWPTVTLSAPECHRLAEVLTTIVPTLRNETFLPHWEYSAEHKLPLIPEPLGLISLSRTEKRVDPMATMGCAVLVVLAALAVLCLLVLFPPWVPGT